MEQVPKKKTSTVPMSEVCIFPVVKRFRTAKGAWKLEDIPQGEIDKLSMHYMKELLVHAENHGFDLNTAFFRDFELASEAFKSALMRSIGKYHPLQEYVDELYREIAADEKQKED